MGLCGLSLLEAGDSAVVTASQSRRISLEAIDSGPFESGLQCYMSVGEIIKIIGDNIQIICATSDDAFATVKTTVGAWRRGAGDITPDLALTAFEACLCRPLPRDLLLGKANRLLLGVIHPDPGLGERSTFGGKW
jgi:hypothetical protein